MSFETSALIVTWVAILLLAFVVAALVRQVHALSEGAAGRRPGRLGPPPGSRAPGYDRLAPTRPDRLLLLFASGGCSTCTAVLDEAAGLASTATQADLAVVALYAGPVPTEAAVPPPVAVRGDEAGLFARYDIAATPFGVLVDREGRVVRAAPLGSAAALRRMVADADDLASSHESGLYESPSVPREVP